MAVLSVTAAQVNPASLALQSGAPNSASSRNLCRTPECHFPCHILGTQIFAVPLPEAFGAARFRGAARSGQRRHHGEGGQASQGIAALLIAHDL